MENRVYEMAHIGCSVTSLQEMLDFLGSVPQLNNIRTQYIDYPYLSGVVGIKNCAIDIGFASKDGDKLIEVLDYRPKNQAEFPNSFLTIGTGFISYTVEDIEETKYKCMNRGARIILDAGLADGGPYAGKKHLFVQKCGVWLEFIEDTPPRLAKAGYIVSDLERCLRFFKRLDLKTDETFHKTLCGENYTAAILRSRRDDFIVELIEPVKKKYYESEIRSDMTGNVHCCFMTDRIDELYEDLCSNGARAQGRVTYITHGANTGAYAAYLTGPDGIKVELFQGKPTKI